MQRRLWMLAALSSLAAVTLLYACGHRDEHANATPAPIVGAINLPISRNHGATEPANAVRIEASQRELRINGNKVLDLEAPPREGRVPASELRDHVITKLQQQIGSARSRERAALWIEASVPYVTTVEILKTLEAAGVREVNFAVRQGMTSNAIGWTKLTRWRVVPEGADFVPFPDRPLPWTAFTEHWHDVYVACRAGEYVDCDGTATRIQEGGNLQMVLWTRAHAMKVTFLRVPPEGEAPLPGASSLADIIMAQGAEAAASPTKRPTKAHRPGPGDFVVPAATEGSFSFRQSEAVDEESAISASLQPVCGTQSCQVVLMTDATTASMRVISLIGAAFPDGATEPQLAFRVPTERGSGFERRTASP